MTFNVENDNQSAPDFHTKQAHHSNQLKENIMNFNTNNVSAAFAAAMTATESSYLSGMGQKSLFAGVFLPGNSFCIHPNAAPYGPVSVKTIKNRWYIVSPEVAQKYYIPDLKAAMLLPAQQEDWRFFLIPLTFPTNAKEEAIQQSLCRDVLQEAPNIWVERGYEPYRHFLKTKGKAVSPYTMWPNWYPPMWIEACFDGRIITEGHPLAKNLRHEEIVEENV